LFCPSDSYEYAGYEGTPKSGKEEILLGIILMGIGEVVEWRSGGVEEERSRG